MPPIGISRRTFARSGLALVGVWTTRLAGVDAPTVPPRLRLSGIAPRAGRAIAASPLGVGFETLDRQMFDPQRTYEALADLGVKWARAQTGWARCETTPGRYDFAWLDKVVDSLRDAGVQPWFNLGYGNRLYMPEAPDPSAVGWAPVRGEPTRQAWVRFVGALAEHFRGRVTHWEIWNEPNIRHFWSPDTPMPAAYMDLVKLTAPVIRQRIPGAVLIGGAFSAMPTEFLEGCLKFGLADHVEKVSYHPYALIPETGYRSTVTAWRTMLARYKPTLALWQGECGCPSSQGGVGALAGYRWNEARQAKWLLRRTLLDLGLGLELVSWFHLVDLVRYAWSGRKEAPAKDGKPRTNFRADFGLLRGDDYTLKPSYDAYQRLCALFDAKTMPADLTVSFAIRPGSDATFSAEKIVQAGFIRGSYPLYIHWWPADVQKDFPARTVDVTISEKDSVALREPVLVDLLEGHIYKLEAQGGNRPWRFAGLPLADYPLLITDAACVLPDATGDKP